jgi:hypothetical protein
MPYTAAELQRIVQWMGEHVPRLMEHGCPLCGAPAAKFGVEQVGIPNLNVPLMAVACRACGYVMLFNAALVLGDSAMDAH